MLIAFVLVASALAFVVLNMGMFTTQKTKEVIARAYEESTRAIDIAGNVKATVSSGNLQLVAIPIKLTSGARPIDLNKTVVAITVIYPDGTAYHTDNGYEYMKDKTFLVITNFGNINFGGDGLDGAGQDATLKATWIYVRSEDKGASTCTLGTSGNEGNNENASGNEGNNENASGNEGNNENAPECEPGDELLEPGEIVLLVFKAPAGTGAYSRIIVEIKPPQGATVTVERIVPPKLDSDYVDLDIG